MKRLFIIPALFLCSCITINKIYYPSKQAAENRDNTEYAFKYNDKCKCYESTKTETLKKNK